MSIFLLSFFGGESGFIFQVKQLLLNLYTTTCYCSTGDISQSEKTYDEGESESQNSQSQSDLTGSQHRQVCTSATLLPISL